MAIPGAEHFLGSIVVTQDIAKRPKIVDGQQRLATCLIFLAAIRDYLYTHDDIERAKILESLYLITPDPDTLDPEPHLQLNGADNEFFRKRILSPPDSTERNVEPSQRSHHRIAKAGLDCINVHNDKKYRMVDYIKEENPPHNVVFPSQFNRLLVQYQEHPEAKSLAPDGTACKSDTKGLLKRAHIVAGEFRYIGKEADRKWEEGEDISVLEFKSTEYGMPKRVVASEEVKKQINEIGIKQCARQSRFSRAFIRKLIRGLPVKRNSHDEFARWFESYKSEKLRIKAKID